MTHLLLDFDGALPRDLYARVSGSCTRLWGWTVEGMRIDRTRRGWHVVVALRERVAPALVVAAQAILGSDPNREAFNLMRVRRLRTQAAFWRERFNVLYSRHSRGVVLRRPA